MNDYIQTADGGRIRWIRPQAVERKIMVIDGKLRFFGESTIDQWLPPEPPEAA